MTICSHAFTEGQLHAGLIEEVIESVERTRSALDMLPRSPQTLDVHVALRTLVGASADAEEIRALPKPIDDLVDILEHVLADYSAALKRLSALAAEAPDPAKEYERLMQEAEKALNPFGPSSDGPARAEAFVRLAEVRRQDVIR